MKFGFIGAGNMGGAILRGALTAKVLEGGSTYVCGRDAEKAKRIAEELGCNACGSVEDLARACDYIIVGVKPKDMDGVLAQVRNATTACALSAKTVVSMAAGIKIAHIEEALGVDAKVVRIMPNTPAMVGAAMTSVSRNAFVTDEDMATVMKIFNAIGMAVEVPEDMIHTVIGVSGSSPAYTYLYIDALIKEAVKEGMDEKQARVFASQAVIGAAKMVLESDEDPQILCKNVCSPGGTTIEAVTVLKNEGFEDLVMKAFKACTDKSKLMSGEK